MYLNPLVWGPDPDMQAEAGQAHHSQRSCPWSSQAGFLGEAKESRQTVAHRAQDQNLREALLQVRETEPLKLANQNELWKGWVDRSQRTAECSEVDQTESSLVQSEMKFATSSHLCVDRVWFVRKN